jgi:hypothetical protein
MRARGALISNNTSLFKILNAQKYVIPASEARRESFLRKDSGQAGMTQKLRLLTVSIY